MTSIAELAAVAAALTAPGKGLLASDESTGECAGCSAAARAPRGGAVGCQWMDCTHWQLIACDQCIQHIEHGVCSMLISSQINAVMLIHSCRHSRTHLVALHSAWAYIPAALCTPAALDNVLLGCALRTPPKERHPTHAQIPHRSSGAAARQQQQQQQKRGSGTATQIAMLPAIT